MADPIHAELEALLPAVRRVVAKIAARSEVDDLTQEWAARLLTRSGLYRKERGSFRAFALTMAGHLARNSRRRPVHESLQQEPIAPPLPPIDADRCAFILDQLPRLGRADRALLEARFAEGLDQAALALQLGISQSAVSRRLEKALATLRRRARRQGLLARLLPFGLAGALAGSGKAQAIAAAVLALVAVAGAQLTPGFFLPGPHVATVANLDDLQRTDFQALRQQPIAPERNALWTGSLALAFDAMVERFGAPKNDASRKTLLEGLSADRALRRAISEENYVAGAGFGDDGTVERLQRDLVARFARGEDPILAAHAARMGRKDVLGYAFLAKSLPFETAFEAMDLGGLGFAEADSKSMTSVQAFGILDFDPDHALHRRLASQVVVHRYESRSDFVLSLSPKDRRDRVIIARMQAPPTLHAGIEHALHAVRAGSGSLLRGDRLAIPCLDFHLSHHFAELARLCFDDEQRGPVVAHGLLQTIRLKLDRSGAEFQARTITEWFAAEPLPRQLIADGPFLVLIAQERDAQLTPLLAGWIANTELLLPWPAKPLR